jgi:hypothetical protein
MSVRDFVILSIGEIILAATFALGILVGASLRRKESSHDDSNGRTEAAAQWNRPRYRDAHGSDERSQKRGVQPASEFDLEQRAAL